MIVVFAALVIAGFYFLLSRENDFGKALRENDSGANDAVSLSPTNVSDQCSVRKAPQTIELDGQLPDAVTEMATSIALAAWKCDFSELADLGEEGRASFSGGVVAFPELADAWEELDACQGHALNLIQLLSRPAEVHDGETYTVFPEADRSSSLGIEGNLFVWLQREDDYRNNGFRLGIHEDGDWLFYTPYGFLFEGCPKGRR